ncbi:MAG: carbon-nitrogen hydrolase family protein [Phycisphaerales bacterium]|nr:carbon-nitrogen hydrolase family protein [Phycisphaerales bacterium]
MPRNVRLTMVTIYNTMRSLADRRAENLEMIDKAGREGSDIVLLPELADHHRTPEGVEAHKEGKAAVLEKLSFTLESPWVREVRGLASKYKMVVIPCILRREEEKMWNSSVVFGPDGKFLGKYDKSHLAPGEEKKFEWGESLEPINTPFGKLGIFTCWDIYFPEITRIYQLQGADLLLWTTMAHGPYAREIYATLLPSRCIITGLPMGVSTYAIDDHLRKRTVMNSVIYDCSGQVLASTNLEANSLTRATIDLDHKPLIPRDWEDLPNTLSFSDLLRAHRRPELYAALTEPRA